MSVSTVFSGIPRPTRRLIFATAAALLVASGAAMAVLTRDLTAPRLRGSGLAGRLMDLPFTNAIVDFELAGHPESSRLVTTGAWRDDSTEIAASLLVDYVFIYGYVMVFALIVVALAERMPAGSTADLVARTWWLPFLAGGLDAVENAGLLAIVGGDHPRLGAEVARHAATGKFLILGFVVLVIVVAAILTIARGPGSAADAEPPH